MFNKSALYDTYQVFFTINFENTSIAKHLKTSDGISFSNYLKTSDGISISNYLKTSNGIKYYNPIKQEDCNIKNEGDAEDWVRSLYYYNPINQIASLPDDYVDDGKHELIIDRTDAGVCNEKGQFTLFKSVSVAYGRKAFRKDINPN